MVTKVLGTTRVKLLAWKGSHGARGKQGVVSVCVLKGEDGILILEMKTETMELDREEAKCLMNNGGVVGLAVAKELSLAGRQTGRGWRWS